MPPTNSFTRSALDVVAAPFNAVGNAASSIVPSGGGSVTSSTTAPSISFGNVNHGLSYPEFNPNDYFATNLFTDSSPLPRTDDATTTEALQSIHEKRNTVKIAKANIQLNKDVVETGTVFQNFLGSVVDYGSAKLGVEAKLLKYQAAQVNVEIAGVKLDQTREKLIQEQVVLGGMQQITPLIREEWEQRKALKQSRINALKQAVATESSKLDEQLQLAASNAVA